MLRVSCCTGTEPCFRRAPHSGSPTRITIPLPTCVERQRRAARRQLLAGGLGRSSASWSTAASATRTRSDGSDSSTRGEARQLLDAGQQPDAPGRPRPAASGRGRRQPAQRAQRGAERVAVARAAAGAAAGRARRRRRGAASRRRTTPRARRRSRSGAAAARPRSRSSAAGRRAARPGARRRARARDAASVRSVVMS